MLRERTLDRAGGGSTDAERVAQELVIDPFVVVWTRLSEAVDNCP